MSTQSLAPKQALLSVINQICTRALRQKTETHALKVNYAGSRECHIRQEIAFNLSNKNKQSALSKARESWQVI